MVLLSLCTMAFPATNLSFKRAFPALRTGGGCSYGTLSLTTARLSGCAFYPALVIGLPKFRSKFLAILKPLHGLWERTDAPLKQPVERKVQIDPIGGVAHVERHWLSETSTQMTDIVRA
jgi:hypothetical protein